jgi:hypothetical protein
MGPDAFWRRKSLSEMSWTEWEAVCDGCARCCLRKLESPGGEEVHYTCVACRLLDIENCRCTAYRDRTEAEPGCLRLTLKDETPFSWLPKSCAYRRLYERKDLPPWHPLITGDPESVHRAGISMRHRAVPETEVAVEADDMERYIIDIDC